MSVPRGPFSHKLLMCLNKHLEELSARSREIFESAAMFITEQDAETSRVLPEVGFEPTPIYSELLVTFCSSSNGVNKLFLLWFKETGSMSCRGHDFHLGTIKPDELIPLLLPLCVSSLTG